VINKTKTVTVTIPVEEIPDGFEVIRVGFPAKGESYIHSETGKIEVAPLGNWASPRVVVKALFNHQKLRKKLSGVLGLGVWVAKDEDKYWRAFGSKPYFDESSGSWESDCGEYGVWLTGKIKFPEVEPKDSAFCLKGGEA